MLGQSRYSISNTQATLIAAFALVACLADMDQANRHHDQNQRSCTATPGRILERISTNRLRYFEWLAPVPKDSDGCYPGFKKPGP